MLDTIQTWYAALGPVVQTLVQATCQASVLVLIVLAVQAVFGRWLSARWRYALWSVVVLRLMLPVTPGSAVSVFNLFRGNPEAVVVVTELPAVSVAGPMEAIDLSGFEPVAYAAGVQPAEPIRAVSPWSTADIMLAAWLAGAALVLSVLLLINVLLAMRLRRGAVLNDPGVLELVEACKREMGVRRAVRLIVLPGVASPALAGVFRPTLLVPPGLLNELPREELRFILLHELAHMKRHDIAMNWLLIALSAAHWFNPLIWFAFARLRADRELARDAMVLRATGTDASQAYGQTIIRVLERMARPRLNNPALAGIGDGMGQLKRRLRMIALSPKRRPALTVVGAVLLATLMAIGLTDAAERETGGKPSEPAESIQVPPAEEAVEPTDAAGAPDTAADRPTPTEPIYETRVYDIRDLLALDFHPEDVQRGGLPHRDERLSQLIGTITETVGEFHEWSINGGDKSAISEFGDKLVIRTSTANHEQIIALLSDLRRGVTAQISFNSTVMVLPDGFFQDAGITAGFTRYAGDTRLVYMDDDQAAGLLRAVRADPSASILTSPLVLQFNGQNAYVSVEQQVTYTAGYERVEGDGGVQYEPTVDTVKEGVVIGTLGAISGDHRFVTATIHATVSNLAQPIEKRRWADSPPDQDLDIEVPEVTKAESEITVTVPERGLALIDTGSVYGPMPGAEDEVKEVVERRVYLLIKPTIIPEAGEAAGVED